MARSKLKTPIRSEQYILVNRSNCNARSCDSTRAELVVLQNLRRSPTKRHSTTRHPTASFSNYCKNTTPLRTGPRTGRRKQLGFGSDQSEALPPTLAETRSPSTRTYPFAYRPTYRSTEAFSFRFRPISKDERRRQFRASSVTPLGATLKTSV